MTQRKNFIYNTIAGLVNASQAIVLSMVVMRTSGLYDAGILSIAFATGNLMMMVGKYGMRNYQVSDNYTQFNFPVYFVFRIIAVVCMCFLSVGYVISMVIFREYSLYKGIIILAMCSIYMIESIEDVFAAQYQRLGKLYLGSILFAVRWCIVLLIISISLSIGWNLLVALLFGNVFNVLVCIIGVCFLNKECCCKIKRVEWKCLLDLCIQCTPLFLSSFLSYYMINVPKYAIDRYLSEEVQACYGFVAMPVFVVGLVSSFLYQPQLVQIADYWHLGLRRKLQQYILRQIGYIVLITVGCFIGANFVGIPVLSSLYSVDLLPYKRELLVLITAGGGLAVVSITSALLTVMRHQKRVLIGYGIGVLVMAIAVDRAVGLYGTMGASLAYLVVITLVVCILLGQLFYMLEKYL